MSEILITSDETGTAREKAAKLGWTHEYAWSKQLCRYHEIITSPGCSVTVPNPKDGTPLTLKPGDLLTEYVTATGEHLAWGSVRAKEIVIGTPDRLGTHRETSPGSGIWYKHERTDTYVAPDDVANVRVRTKEGQEQFPKAGDRISLDPAGNANVILAAKFAKEFTPIDPAEKKE